MKFLFDLFPVILFFAAFKVFDIYIATGVVIAATGYAGNGSNANLGTALGGIIVCGALYTLIGLVVMG